MAESVLAPAYDSVGAHMPAFIYRCPITGQHVQGWVVDDGEDDLAFNIVTCLACQRGHVVNTKTGKVLGAAEDE